MAAIGMASNVMKRKGFPNARTIHSWLYDYVEEYKIDKNTGLIEYDSQFGTKVTKMSFIPKSTLPDIDLMVVDEGYCVPYRHRPIMEKHRIPIVTAGDANQLPPIGDRPAFIYDPSKLLYLTEIMRQKENSGILYLAKRAIMNLPIHHGFYNDALVIYEDELDDRTLMEADCIICGTNSTRDNINRYLRNIRGYKGDLPNYGEKVICRKNNFKFDIDGVNLTNGLRGTVVNQPNICGLDGKRFMMDFQPDDTNVVFFDTGVDYTFFNAPYSEKNKLKNRPYSYGEYFDFGDCITTHLAQGGQWKKVIYFEDYLPNDMNKLNHVAATRAEEALIWVKRRPKVW